MAHILYFCIVGFCLCGHAATFLPGSEDIPLMPGMQTKDVPAIFDKVSGHIFSTTTDIQKTPRAIFHFYDETLKNLGWTKTGKGHYRRGNQVLLIKVQGKPPIHSVHFELSEDLS